jgi:hypothetical protein
LPIGLPDLPGALAHFFMRGSIHNNRSRPWRDKNLTLSTSSSSRALSDG